jgi:hypothetical protein
MLKAKIPQLGDLFADVWVSERHRREMEVTQNPVEFGSPVTDHAFVKAQSLSVSFGVSNTPLVDNDAFTDIDRVDEARTKLYELQNSKTFLNVKTINGGEYNNMLLTGIGWTTDDKNPHAVIFDLDLEEVIVVTTEQTEYQALPAEKKTEKKTKPTSKRGTKPKKKLETDKKGRKRTSTRDVSSSSKEQAKAAAATKQRGKIK